MLGIFNSSVVNAALILISKEFHVPVGSAPLQTSTVIIVVGVAPLFWTPLANVYGRRPVYIFSTVVGIVGTVGSAVAKSWGTLIFARFVSGLGVGAAMCLGAATVTDVFFMHEVRRPDLDCQC